MSTTSRTTRLERIGVCYRWAWCWRGFWRGWWKEAKGAGLMVWMGALGLAGAIVQAGFVIVFPAWRLLIEPLKVGLRINERAAENIRKVLDK